MAIAPQVHFLAHPDAYAIFDSVLHNAESQLVFIDMSLVDEATTSAFARLVLLRKALLRTGRDLRLTGLRDRAARLYEIAQLQRVLPAC